MGAPRYRGVDLARVPPDLREFFASLHDYIDRTVSPLVTNNLVQQSDGSPKSWQKPYAYPGPDYLKMSRDDVSSGLWMFKKPVYFPEGLGNADITNQLEVLVQVAAGGKLILPAGSFRVTRKISVPSNTVVVGQGKGITIIDGSAIDGTVFEVVGSTSDEIYVSSDVDHGDTTISFADASSLSRNDLCVLANMNEPYAIQAGASESARMGYMFRIKDKSSNTIYPDVEPITNQTLDGVYSVSDFSYVRKLTPHTNVVLSGMTIIGTKDYTIDEVPTVHVKYASNVILDDLAIETARSFGLQIQQAENVLVSRSRFTESSVTDTVDEDPQVRHGISIDQAGRCITIRDCYFEKWKRQIMSRGAYQDGTFAEGVPYGVLVVNSKFVNPRNVGVNAYHGGMHDLSVIGCEFWGSNADMLADVTSTGQVGIRFEELTFAMAANCKFWGIKSSDIVVTGHYHVSIQGCQFHGTGTRCVDIQRYGESVHVKDCTADDVGRFLRVTGEYSPKNVRIEGNSVRKYTAGSCIEFVDCTLSDLRILDNRFSNNNAGASNYVIEWDGCTINDGNINGNTFDSITGSVTIEKETNGPTLTRIRRRENRTVGCDNYYDNDGRLHYLSAFTWLNQDVLTHHAFGGYTLLSSGAGSTTITNIYAGYCRVVFTSLGNNKSGSMTIEGTSYDPDTGSETGSDSEVVTVPAGSTDKNFFSTKIWRGTGATANMRITYTESGGSTTRAIYLMTVWNNNGNLFRVKRVGWIAEAYSAVQMRAATIKALSVDDDADPSTAAYQEIADLTATSAMTAVGPERYWDFYRNVDVVIDGSQTGHGFLFEFDWESLISGNWKEMQLYMYYEDDFRISD